MVFGHPQMQVLNGNYMLVKPVRQRENYSISETWSGIDIKKENEYLIRIWPNDATNLQRALWDKELRKLYRVSSSPGSENYLLTLKDAGYDDAQRCFVMVSVAKGFGYTPLDQLLRDRSMGTWLDIKNVEARQRIWLGLLKIVYGIDILHSQNVLHRNINAENIFLHPDEGPESLLLGGFEWSIRIGEYLSAPSKKKQKGPLNSEADSTLAFNFEDDWYDFGLLAARCLLNIENCYGNKNASLDGCVISSIKAATNTYLTELEKSVLLRLVSSDSTGRLVYSYHIINEIQEILKSLIINTSKGVKNPTLVLTYNEDQCDDIQEQAARSGWMPNPKNPSAVFNPNEITHLQSLSEFLQRDFQQAQIYYYHDDQHILLGDNMCLMIRKIRFYDKITQDYVESWDAAYASKTAYLYSNPDLKTMQKTPMGAIVVMPFGKFKEIKAIKNQTSWQRYLPSLEVGLEMRENMRHFYDFIICVNQLELLFRDAELFQYIVKSRTIDNNFETIEIGECPRERSPIKSFAPSGGLLEYVQTELTNGDMYSNLFILSLANDGSLRISPDIEPNDCYTVVATNKDEGTVRLRKAFRSQDDRAPDFGWIKSFGMRLQMGVIRRRQQAIYRLQKHAYLLESLIATGKNYIDTGPHNLSLVIQTEKIDGAKQAVMRDILRTRPIYALQGPPGTGKSTLVAHLVRQIFNDDPVAQILITAQAHSAVNVLQRKVIEEAFEDVQPIEKPLSIRIGIRNNDEMDDTYSLLSVSKNILSQVLQGLQNSNELSEIQIEWQEYIQGLQLSLNKLDVNEEYPDELSEFMELVKRSANIVFSTTNAGDLEAISKDTQQFDWSIIEEAGKCLPVDLVLPMQIGHRWVLIGDWKQLEPYRIEEYEGAIQNMPKMIDALKELPDRAGGILDFGWIERWEALSPDGQLEFGKFSLSWLYTFKKIFENCESAPNGPSNPIYTTGAPIGACAGKLTGQYRMHPTLGTLISKVYYDDELINRTISESSGYPASHVSIELESPSEFQETSLIWIDTPSTFENNLAFGGGKNIASRISFTNQFEVNVIKEVLKQIKVESRFLRDLQQRTGKDKPLTLSILSPYRQQTKLLNKKISIDDFPVGIGPQAGLGVNSPENIRFTHTVDSFQGNEADIIIISMVRNNQLSSSEYNPLGFLTKEKRMNVLLSRARRLMILVGDWKFFNESIRIYSDNPALPGWHLANAFSIINRWVEEGEAKLIPASKYVDF